MHLIAVFPSLTLERLIPPTSAQKTRGEVFPLLFIHPLNLGLLGSRRIHPHLIKCTALNNVNAGLISNRLCSFANCLANSFSDALLESEQRHYISEAKAINYEKMARQSTTLCAAGVYPNENALPPYFKEK